MRCLAYIAVLSLYGCAHKTMPPAVEVTPAEIEHPVKETRTPLQIYDEKIKPGSEEEQLVADVRWLLVAKEHESKNELGAARDAYFEALKFADGAFAEIAIKNWSILLARTQPQKPTHDELTQLAESRLNQIQNNFLVSKKFNQPVKLAKFLRDTVPKTFVIEPESQPKENSSNAPDNDPLHIKAARVHCKDKGEVPKNLVSENYWNALVADCQNRPHEAIKFFTSSLPKLSERKFSNHALYASSRLVRLYRQVDQRHSAATEYKRLVALWQAPGLKPLNTTPFKFREQRINDHLWAARYTALIGEHNFATDYVKAALKLTSKSLSRGRLNSAQRRILREYQAEAYHVQASRIAVEKKDFREAIDQSKLALQIPGLSTQWRTRFNWYIGLYLYISSQYEPAAKYWERLLEKTRDENFRAQLYFWLAKSAAKLDQKEQTEFFLRALKEEHPLSFYSVVAAREFDDKSSWMELFSPRKKLDHLLSGQKNVDISVLRQDHDIAPLLRRAEILAQLKLSPWDKIGVNEFGRKLRGTYRVYSRTIGGFIYLSRLYAAAGMYRDSIWLTTELNKLTDDFWLRWPEQVLFFYPRPQIDLFTNEANRNGLTHELLLAISRQETGFTADAISPAGAIGMMQLIPETAKRMAAEIGVDIFALENQLISPSFNIALGATYLKILMRRYGNFSPAVYAAYNAGEYAVDQWMERRMHTDKLVWLELIPFGETRNYTKRAWRNAEVYAFLSSKKEAEVSVE